jgi:hypothetical protein
LYLLISWLAYPWTLKMLAVCSSEVWGCVWNQWCYNPKVCTLHTKFDHIPWRNSWQLSYFWIVVYLQTCIPLLMFLLIYVVNLLQWWQLKWRSYHMRRDSTPQHDSTHTIEILFISQHLNKLFSLADISSNICVI